MVQVSTTDMAGINFPDGKWFSIKNGSFQQLLLFMLGSIPSALRIIMSLVRLCSGALFCVLDCQISLSRLFVLVLAGSDAVLPACFDLVLRNFLDLEVRTDGEAFGIVEVSVGCDKGDCGIGQCFVVVQLFGSVVPCLN